MMPNNKKSLQALSVDAECFQSAFLKGVQAISPLTLAVMPWGVLAGSLAIDTGLSFSQACAMSAMMFAGAAQLISLELIGAGASFLTIVVSVFFLTSQHFIYALNFRTHVKHLPLYQRLLIGFLLTDELFAIGMSNRTQLSFAYLLGAGLSFYLGWVLFSLIGIFLASQIPHLEKLHLDFSIVALLILIVVPMIKSVQCFIGVFITLVFACVFKYFHFEAGLVLAGVLGMLSAVCTQHLRSSWQ